MRNNYSTPKLLRDVLRAVLTGLGQSSQLPQGLNLKRLRAVRIDLTDNHQPSESVELTGDQAGAEPAQPILYYYIMAGSY